MSLPYIQSKSELQAWEHFFYKSKTSPSPIKSPRGPDYSIIVWTQIKHFHYRRTNLDLFEALLMHRNRLWSSISKSFRRQGLMLKKRVNLLQTQNVIVQVCKMRLSTKNIVARWGKKIFILLILTKWRKLYIKLNTKWEDYKCLWLDNL